VVDTDRMQAALGGRWTLVELEGEALADQGSAPYLELDAEASTLAGSGGCNRLAGGFEVGDAGFRFGPVATTLRACDEEIMRREAAFLAVLEAADGVDLDDAGLALLAEGRVLARLSRVQ
jgi:heat shock protein HslJ